MINSAVSNALMPKPVTATAGTPLAIGYAFAVHQLALSKLAANHFICAIINKGTGNVLEYHHLVKNRNKNCVKNKLCKQNRTPVPGDTRTERHKYMLLHKEISSPHLQTAHVLLDCL
jgi:hypothetical protein